MAPYLPPVVSVLRVLVRFGHWPRSFLLRMATLWSGGCRRRFCMLDPRIELYDCRFFVGHIPLDGLELGLDLRPLFLVLALVVLNLLLERSCRLCRSLLDVSG